MSKWPPRPKSLEERKFSYMHYGVLLFAQGTWSEKDRKQVNELLLNHPKSQSDELFLVKGSYPSNCDLCNQIHEIFSAILGKNDGMMFFTHDIWLEISGIKLLTELIGTSEKVKKFYIFQGGPIERNALSKGKFTKMKLIKEIILKDRLKFQKVTKKEFFEILDANGFEEEILYEVINVRA